MGPIWMVVLAAIVFKVFRAGLAAIFLWLVLPVVFGISKQTARKAAMTMAAVLIIFEILMVVIRTIL